MVELKLLELEKKLKQMFMKSLMLAFSTFVTCSVSAQTVQDGDSVIRGDGVRVRLYGIDAP